MYPRQQIPRLLPKFLRKRRQLAQRPPGRHIIASLKLLYPLPVERQVIREREARTCNDQYHPNQSESND